MTYIVPNPSCVLSLFLSVFHEEMNAILNKNSSDVKGCTMYVVLFPCNECAIIQSSIAEVVYVSDKYQDKPEMKESKRLLDMAGVECRYTYSAVNYAK